MAFLGCFSQISSETAASQSPNLFYLNNNFKLKTRFLTQPEGFSHFPVKNFLTRCNDFRPWASLYLNGLTRV
ncbi:hypothetical protein FHS90_000858 [Rufibacter quisquiliarum]|uniref:Uncharacterized protein n=1 Tax=Rufibacter quisquiliarum TaxID=1549639 RepID=A0A839GMG4_9BACT|nr:hypothetical protein [Rufibacter quisquiliarum]